jgi:hypothetical protein
VRKPTGAKMSARLRFKATFSHSIRRRRNTKPVLFTPLTLRDAPQSEVEGSGQREDMGFGGQERRGHFSPPGSRLHHTSRERQTLLTDSIIAHLAHPCNGKRCCGCSSALGLLLNAKTGRLCPCHQLTSWTVTRIMLRSSQESNPIMEGVEKATNLSF